MGNSNKDIQKQKFAISYDGEAMKKSHSMSVEDLAPALLALDKIFQISNTLLNGHNSNAHLKVVGQRSGSFEIILDLIQNLPEMMKIIETYDSKKLLYALFGASGMFALIKMLGKNKENPKTSNQSLTLNGIIFKPTIIQLFNNEKMKKETKEFLNPLFKTGIEQLKVLEGKELLCSVNSEEASHFLHQNDKEIDIVKNIFIKSYHIRSLTFEKGKWKLSDNSSTIIVSIEDEAFMQKAENDLLSFSSGDILECKVREEQKKLNGKLKSSYFIEKVLKHKPSAKQMSFLIDDTKDKN